jgi:hypothetical protein
MPIKKSLLIEVVDVVAVMLYFPHLGITNKYFSKTIKKTLNRQFGKANTY